MLGLWAALWQFPELPFAEQDGNSGDGRRGTVAFVDWEGGAWRSLCQCLARSLGAAGSTDAPCPLLGLGSP